MRPSAMCRNAHMRRKTLRTAWLDVRRGAALARSFLKRHRRLIHRPVDDLEKHAALEHLLFEIGSVRFPLRCFSNAELGCYALTVQCVVSRQSATHRLVHHGEAVICERSIIHRSQSCDKATVTAFG